MIFIFVEFLDESSLSIEGLKLSNNNLMHGLSYSICTLSFLPLFVVTGNRKVMSESAFPRYPNQG